MRRALVTGSSAGIGRALCQRLAGAGYAVEGVDREKDAHHLCDLAEREQVDGLARKLSKCDPYDVVVHNAGISCVGPFERTELAEQQRVLAVNLEAPIVLTAALVRTERVARGGTIAFLSSLSHQVGYPSASVYAATKDGLASYARSLDVALHPRRVRTLRVFPGPVRTEHAARYSPPDSDASKRMPPEQVAAAIVRAIQRRKRVLIPGGGAKVFAFVGRWFPGVTERALKKALYDPLSRRSTGPA